MLVWKFDSEDSGDVRSLGTSRLTMYICGHQSRGSVRSNLQKWVRSTFYTSYVHATLLPEIHSFLPINAWRRREKRNTTTATGRSRRHNCWRSEQIIFGYWLGMAWYRNRKGLSFFKAVILLRSSRNVRRRLRRIRIQQRLLSPVTSQIIWTGYQWRKYFV